MFGLLAYVGVVYKSIVIFIFFLVCGLGVDDSFLMLHALRMQMRRHGSNDVPTVMAKTMRIVCVCSHIFADDLHFFRQDPA